MSFPRQFSYILTICGHFYGALSAWIFFLTLGILESPLSPLTPQGLKEWRKKKDYKRHLVSAVTEIIYCTDIAMCAQGLLTNLTDIWTAVLFILKTNRCYCTWSFMINLGHSSHNWAVAKQIHLLILNTTDHQFNPVLLVEYCCLHSWSCVFLSSFHFDVL